MAFRNPQDAHGLQLVDPVLTNLALHHRSEGFIYDEVVSHMDVATDSGLYPIWAREDFMRDDVEAAVTDRAETPEIDFRYDLAPYLLRPYRLKVTISAEERAQAHSALRFEQTKVEGLMDRFRLIRERRLAKALRKTSNGGQLTLGGTVSTKWDASSGATIEKDIKAAREAVRNATGQMVDTIVMDWAVAGAIAIEPAIRDILKYTVPGDLIIANGEAILPKTLWGLNVVIAGAMVNGAREGAAESLGAIWGDNVRLIKRAKTNAWGTPATVYNLRGQVAGQRPSGEGHGAPTSVLVDRWTTPDPPVDHIRGWEKVQEKVVAADVAYEIADVLT